MRIFFMYFNPMINQGAFFAPENAVVEVFKKTLDVRYISAPTPDGRRSGLWRHFDKWRQRRKYEAEAAALCQNVRENLSKDGPNILIHMVHSGGDMFWSRLLEPVWQKFSHRILYINENMKPTHTSRNDIQRFDKIICFCGDLAEEYDIATGVPTTFWPAHSDVLNYHSLSHYRPIDLIVVGRRAARWHEPMHRHFNQPDRERLFLDFVTRTQGRQPPEEQFRILMTTYGRSKASFCFEPSDVPRYDGRSPLLNRWVHSWASGCAVFGTRPFGKGTAEQLDWPDAVIELPERTDEAIELVEQCLLDQIGLRRMRLRNIVEAMAKHDTRIRIRDLLRSLDIKEPPSLTRELAQLAARRQEIIHTEPRLAGAD